MLKRSDTGKIASAAEIGYSDPKTLKENAEDFLVLLNVSFSRRLYYQVNHMGHIATELAMKAAYARNNGKAHPWGHDLQQVCMYEYLPGQSVFADLSADTTIRTHYNRIKAAWVMQDRYQRKLVTQESAANYKIAYREVTKWIFMKYL